MYAGNGQSRNTGRSINAGETVADGIANVGEGVVVVESISMLVGVGVTANLVGAGASQAERAKKKTASRRSFFIIASQ